ncbi:MAG: delta-aminolevulinic acid dehydratase [Bacteroidetes bacterium]|nr:delta-aminolevulinic acid dehydratase [Bacteroidota bacterium]
MLTKFHESFKKLAAYCEKEQFKGYDPYDGLNSKLFQSIPLIPRSRIMRLAWIQFFKRSPLNLRKVVGIKKEYNPKALGLFLSAYCILYKHDKNPAHVKSIEFFVEKIEACRTKGYSGACWGYNFDWESRAFFQPKFTPTIVASSFIANALMDAYDITGDEKLLTTARSTCDFILKDLNRTHDAAGNYAFSYSPLDNSVVFNASLLGARLLARVYSHTKETSLISESKKAVAFCVNYQKEDGSWSYGTLPFHQWIDNFHTGYNLECISDYMKYSRDISYSEVLHKGFKYYIETFFTNEGVSKYYSNSIYPIDIHAPSQLIITLQKLGKMDAHKELMDKVINWTIDHMQSKEGFFRYQVNKYVTSKIPYMRWSQAWMFVSLSIYLNHYMPKTETIL